MPNPPADPLPAGGGGRPPLSPPSSADHAAAAAVDVDEGRQAREKTPAPNEKAKSTISSCFGSSEADSSDGGGSGKSSSGDTTSPPAAARSRAGSDGSGSTAAFRFSIDDVAAGKVGGGGGGGGYDGGSADDGSVVRFGPPTRPPVPPQPPPSSSSSSSPSPFGISGSGTRRPPRPPALSSPSQRDVSEEGSGVAVRFSIDDVAAGAVGGDSDLSDLDYSNDGSVAMMHFAQSAAGGGEGTADGSVVQFGPPPAGIGSGSGGGKMEEAATSAEDEDEDDDDGRADEQQRVVCQEEEGMVDEDGHPRIVLTSSSLSESDGGGRPLSPPGSSPPPSMAVSTPSAANHRRSVSSSPRGVLRNSISSPPRSSPKSSPANDTPAAALLSTPLDAASRSASMPVSRPPPRSGTIRKSVCRHDLEHSRKTVRNLSRSMSRRGTAAAGVNEDRRRSSIGGAAAAGNVRGGGDGAGNGKADGAAAVGRRMPSLMEHQQTSSSSSSDGDVNAGGYFGAPALSPDGQRLAQTLQDAVEDMYGVSAAEVWVLDEDETGMLERPEGGWWRSNASATSTTGGATEGGSGADDDDTTKVAEALRQLEDPSHIKYVPADPVPPGVGLAGRFWAESGTSSSSFNNSYLSPSSPAGSLRGGTLFGNLSNRGGNVFGHIHTFGRPGHRRHHSHVPTATPSGGGGGGGIGGSERGGRRSSRNFTTGGGDAPSSNGGSSKGGNFFANLSNRGGNFFDKLMHPGGGGGGGGGGSNRGGTVFGGGSNRGGNIFGHRPKSPPPPGDDEFVPRAPIFGMGAGVAGASVSPENSARGGNEFGAHKRAGKKNAAGGKEEGDDGFVDDDIEMAGGNDDDDDDGGAEVGGPNVQFTGVDQIMKSSAADTNNNNGNEPFMSQERRQDGYARRTSTTMTEETEVAGNVRRHRRAGAGASASSALASSMATVRAANTSSSGGGRRSPPPSTTIPSPSSLPTPPSTKKSHRRFPSLGSFSRSSDSRRSVGLPSFIKAPSNAPASSSTAVKKPSHRRSISAGNVPFSLLSPGGGASNTPRSAAGSGGGASSGAGNEGGNNTGGGGGGVALIWRDLPSLLLDPDAPFTPRLPLLIRAGYVQAAACPFHSRSSGHRGVVIYLCRESADAGRLTEGSNQTLMVRAAEWIGVTVSVLEARRAREAVRWREERERRERIIDGRAEEGSTDVEEQNRGGNKAEDGRAGATRPTSEDAAAPSSSPKKKLMPIDRGDESRLRKRLRVWSTKCRGPGGAVPVLPRTSTAQSLWTFAGSFSGLLLLSGLGRSIHVLSDGGASLGPYLPPMGALMALQYGLTAAPASQPRNALLGQALAGFIAMIFTYVPEVVLPRSVRVALAPAAAIAATVRAGVVHPPAGAAAVLLSTGMHNGWELYGLFLACTALSLLPAVTINNLSLKRQYPTHWAILPHGWTGERKR